MSVKLAGNLSYFCETNRDRRSRKYFVSESRVTQSTAEWTAFGLNETLDLEPGTTLNFTVN